MTKLTKEKALKQKDNIMFMDLSNINFLLFPSLLKALLDENLDIDEEIEKELDK